MRNQPTEAQAKAYKLSKAGSYLRKAEIILEDLELDNYKVQGDFISLYQYVNDLSFRIRKQFQGVYIEKYVEDNN